MRRHFLVLATEAALRPTLRSSSARRRSDADVRTSMDLGFATVVEESGPAEVVIGVFTLCVDFPPTGQVRRVFGADSDNSAETNQGLGSAALRIYGLSSETMTARLSRRTTAGTLSTASKAK